jgi:hypothetical protein
MIAFLIQWEKFSFESSVNFSAVTDELPEQIRSETSYLFRMIEHEWKKLQNVFNENAVILREINLVDLRNLHTWSTVVVIILYIHFQIEFFSWIKRKNNSRFCDVERKLRIFASLRILLAPTRDDTPRRYTSKWCGLNSTQLTSTRSGLDNTVSFQKFNSILILMIWCELVFDVSSNSELNMYLSLYVNMLLTEIYSKNKLWFRRKHIWWYTLQRKRSNFYINHIFFCFDHSTFDNA